MALQIIENESDYIKSMLELKNQHISDDRTGTGTSKQFNRGFEFNIGGINKSLPILIGKHTGLKAALIELTWIMLGKSDLKWLKDHGVNYWDQWVKDDGTFGPIYGRQMRDFGMLGTVDQLQDLVNGLRDNFKSRRHIVSLWDPTTMDKQALPPCFTPGKHYVKVNDGYKLIENVNIGDCVLGDDSKYHKVYDTMKTKYVGETIKIKHKLSSIKIESTPNHPFLVKDKGYVKSGDLKVGDYVALTNESPEKEIEKIDISYVNKKGETKTEYFGDIEEWYFMGYYLGNGHRGGNPDKRKYFISIPDKKREEVLSKINNKVPISIINNSGENVRKFQGANYRWWNLLAEFGTGAKNKRIPDFIIQSSPEFLTKFLEGYSDADGCKTNIYDMCATTVSPEIAYGIQALYSKLGKSCRTNFTEKSATTVILGRTVNQNHVFSISQHKNNKIEKGDGCYNEGLFTWIRINEIEKQQYDGYVYNLSVEDNHTYTVNNIVNHNCHCFYNITTESRQYQKIFNLHVTQRSGDSYLGVPYDLLMFMYFMKIIEFLVNDTDSGEFKQANNLYLTVNDYHLYSNHHNAIEKYAVEYAQNSIVKNYKPPTTINFNNKMVDWKKSVGGKIELNQLLEKIVEEKFDVFDFGIRSKVNNIVNWKQPKDLSKIHAKVAV